jgi:acyl carrier protein
MELNEFIDKFAEQFEDTDPSEITASTNYRELDEWSSLIGMMVIAFVKTDLNKTVTGDDLKACKSVEQLYNLIMAKQ